MKKRAQMKISFGMIFSIILTIAIIAFAIYGITVFLNIQKNAALATFSSSVQQEVKTVWESQGATRPVSLAIHSDVDEVCFYSGDEFGNMEFRPYENNRGVDVPYINHLAETDLCIPVRDDKVNFYLRKNFDEDVVHVSRTR